MGNQPETRYIVIPDTFIGDIRYQKQEPKFKKAINDDDRKPVDLSKGAKELEALNKDCQQSSTEYWTMCVVKKEGEWE